MNNFPESQEFKQIKKIVPKNDDKKLIYKEVEKKIKDNAIFNIKESNITMKITNSNGTSNSNGTFHSSFNNSDLVYNNSYSSSYSTTKSEREDYSIEPKTQQIIDDIYNYFERYIMNNDENKSNQLLLEFYNYCFN
jgi:hypothetical protein